jgi:hypothetical protein
MPRRRRAAKARIPGVGQLTPDQRAWFFNPFAELDLMGNGVCEYAHRIVFASVADARAAWEQHRDELVTEFQAAAPGQEPWPARVWGQASPESDGG